MKRIAVATLLLLALAGCGGSSADEGRRPAAVIKLPALPAEGFAVQTSPRVVEFHDLQGRRLGSIKGFRLAPRPRAPLAVVRGKRVLVLDLARRRIEPLAKATVLRAVREAHRACQGGPVRAGTRYLLCRRDRGTSIRATVERIADGHRSVVTANPPPTRTASGAGRIGHWESAFLSPDGRTLLLQWSAECEVPYAFLARATGGRPRVVSGESDWAKAPESVALGFARDGRAVVLFPSGGACGAAAAHPGIYALDPATSKSELIRPPPGSGEVVMWGPYAASVP